MRLALQIFGLKNSGLVVAFALLAQILAPIGGVWAATAKAADPLSAAPICSGLNPHQPENGTSAPRSEHSSCCPLCAVAQPVPLPEHPATGLVLRASRQVTWVQFEEPLAVAQGRGPAQARAPPSLV